VLVGLDASVGTADLVHATLEGVAFSLLEARRLLEASGVGQGRVAAVGGGARSRFLMQLVANVLGVAIVRHVGRETAPARGAARLARMALTGESAEAVCTEPPVQDVLEPDRALTAAYAEGFESYRRLYQALKSEFHRGLTSPP
jgi:xylulokinase